MCIIRQCIFPLLSLAACSLRAHGDEDHTLFLQANKLYQSGYHAEALERYERISPKGPSTWYNIGICHQAQGNTAKAVACFKRARNGASYRQLRRIDERVAQLRTPEQSAHDMTWYARLPLMMLRGVYAAHPLVLQLLFLLLWYLIFIPWILTGKRPRYTQLTLIVLLAPAILATYTHQHTVTGVVAAGGGSLYAGPAENFRKLCTIAAADDVVIRDQQPGWYKVCHANRTGWMLEKELMLVTSEQS